MNPLIVPLKICPVAPTGVAAYTDQISGMVLWSVLWLFGIAALATVSCSITPPVVAWTTAAVWESRWVSTPMTNSTAPANMGFTVACSPSWDG
ncbi:MAG: hypothetical protein GX454_11765 [Brooklawnia sp.]|nr:hypothetical protein [Brooklawnia sp.]